MTLEDRAAHERFKRAEIVDCALPCCGEQIDWTEIDGIPTPQRPL
jgi:hypothetical protein